MKFKLIVLSALAAAATFTAAAQQATPTPAIYSAKTLAELPLVRDAALKSDYAYERTRFMTNNIGPRLSGSAQAARAVEYVAEEMRELGLEVRLQELKVPHWVRGIETGELTEFPGMAKGTTQKIVLTALGGSVATPESGLTAELVVVTSYEQLERLGRKGIEGKIVLFNEKFDHRLSDSGEGLKAYGQAVRFRGGGPSAASRLGAVAVLVRSAGASQMRLPHTGGTRYADDVKKIPAASVTYEDADLIDDLVKQGTTKMRLVLTPKTYPDAVSHNVIADLKGSERPDEIVIVSGHLDSWDLGTGALDDATGVAAAMQVPYLLKQLGLQPKRTIRVIAYMNEENGLVGGTEYAKAEANNIANHIAAIEADLGASHPMGVLFAGKPEALPFFTPFLEVLREHGSGLIRTEGGVGADIGPLTQRGVPSFAPWFNTRTYFMYHHTAADTFDKVNPEELARVGSVMAVTAYALANMEQPLPR
ncbi:MAG: M28 family peptidase [Acidobacteria bacterium]|nr:M28 family peptidase [Acidobacteriota bacterium]